MNTETLSRKSEIARRASLCRKAHRGGRPRLPQNDLPAKSVKLAARDFAVLQGYARQKSITLTEALHRIAAHIVIGGTADPHPELAPAGWVW